MESHNQYDKIVLKIIKILIRFLMGVLTICIIFGAADLIYYLYHEITTSPNGLLDITHLLEVFSLALTVAVGYELVKSMHTLIVSPVIPSIPLVQIGIIALSNKMITIDFKTVAHEKLFGMAAIMVSLGLTYFFLKYAGRKNEKVNKELALKKEELTGH